MALNKTQLVTELQAVLDDQRENKTHAQMAQALADAIDNYVKTGEVVVSGGSSAGTYPVT